MNRSHRSSSAAHASIAASLTASPGLQTSTQEESTPGPTSSDRLLCDYARQRMSVGLVDGGEFDRLSSLLEGLDRRFQHPDHPQTRIAVGQGLPVLANAFEEMLRLHPKALRQAELRCPHVPGPVSDERLVHALWTAVERDAFVIDLDLLARFQVVVDDHLAV